MIVNVVFVAVFALFSAVGLLIYSHRAAKDGALARRLGRLKHKSDDDGLLMNEGGDEESTIAQTVAESGLGWTMSMFVTRALLASVMGLLIGLTVGSNFLAFVFAILGSVIVWIFVGRARARRLALCDEQMPQALEIMALALRAGHALPRALDLAAEETPAPLCYELRRAADEQALGRPIGEVLAAFGAKLPGCEAVNTFVVAVLVLQETGGNLIAVIDRIVENARATSSYQARLRALTAEGRQSAKLLAMLPGAFGVLAMMSDPAYADMLLHDSGGRMITIIAGGLWLLGILWTRRLVRPLS